MKILHIVPSAIRGGVEKNCYHFIRATQLYDHSVVVLSSNGPMVSDWSTLSVPVKVLDIMKQRPIAFRASLIRDLPLDAFTRVIVWTNARMPIVANALNKYHAKLFFHIGNPIPRSRRIEFQMRVLSLVFPARNSIQLRPVSRHVQNGLHGSHYYRKFPSRVSLKPIAFPDHPPAVVRHVDESTDVNIGMVARLDQVKDHETVISAFSILRGTFPNATLHLAGDGDLMGSLQKRAIAIACPDCVIFHGDTIDVFGLMRKWDLFVYATTPSEGLGGTIPEALAIGLPVVATDLPMVREWDKEGKFVTYCSPFEPADMAMKAIALLRDLSKRKFVNEEAPAFVRSNYSAERFATNYISDEPSV